MSSHSHIILAIDDDVDDLFMLQETLKAIAPNSSLLTANNGALGLEKLEQLRNEGRLPCLIVLDVNMPVMDGRQTYEAIKADKDLAGIPVVVFSTSTSPLDKTYFKHKGAEYMIKPVSYEQLLEATRRFLDYCKC